MHRCEIKLGPFLFGKDDAEGRPGYIVQLEGDVEWDAVFN